MDKILNLDTEIFFMKKARGKPGEKAGKKGPNQDQAGRRIDRDLFLYKINKN